MWCTIFENGSNPAKIHQDDKPKRLGFYMCINVYKDTQHAVKQNSVAVTKGKENGTVNSCRHWNLNRDNKTLLQEA